MGKKESSRVKRLMDKGVFLTPSKIKQVFAEIAFIKYKLGIIITLMENSNHESALDKIKELEKLL